MRSTLAISLLSASIALLATSPIVKAAVTPKEIFAFSWTPPTYSSGSGAHIYPMTWVTVGVDNPASIATLATSSPIGRRAVFVWDGQRSIMGNASDKCIDPGTNVATSFQCPYFGVGISMTQGKFQTFFDAYKAAGGSLDYLVLDSEMGLSNWHLGTSSASYDAIETDSRYSTSTYPELISMASAAGLPSLTFQPLRKIGTNYDFRDEIGVWNELMYERIGDAVASAVAIPLFSQFPSAKMSDYGNYWHHPSYPMYDANGWPLAQFGTGVVAGTHGAPSLYGLVFGMQYSWLSPSGQTYPPTKFNGFRADVNTMLGVMLGTAAQLGIAVKNVKTSPWFPYRGFNLSTYRNSDYYQETILHTVLAGADHLLFWNPSGQADNEVNDHQIFSNTLTELNDLVGYSDRKTLVSNLASWTSNFIVSTTRANGKKISRLTPAEEYQAACSTNPNGVLACAIGNESVHFNSGIIHTPPNSVSTVGIWVIQPGNAMNPY